MTLAPQPGAGSPGGNETAAAIFKAAASACADAALSCERAGHLRQQTALLLTAARAIQQDNSDAAGTDWQTPAGRELLRRSRYARLTARLESLPLIEQAKGIIMAQSHCAPDAAFDLLRRASQRSNLPVRELAAKIVTSTTTPDHTADRPRPPPR